MLGTVLAVSICQWKRDLSSQELRGLIYEHMRPVVMGALIIMYFFTVLHKLNWDFFNPAVSCAVSMHKELAASVPIVPSGTLTHWPTIIGTLFFELIIPLGLWWRKTRVAAVLLGLFFHWFLALHPHGGIYSFSHLLYVLYAVFLFSSQDNPFCYKDQHSSPRHSGHQAGCCLSFWRRTLLTNACIQKWGWFFDG